jgi:hypothetical protein
MAVRATSLRFILSHGLILLQLMTVPNSKWQATKAKPSTVRSIEPRETRNSARIKLIKAKSANMSDSQLLARFNK